MKPSVEQLLSKMKSEYIPQHVAAANDFISCGYSVDLLKQALDKERISQWVSMYLYICSKQNRVLEAWEYVQYRVESEPELFEIDGHANINRCGDEQAYLFNAARKWLITPEHLNTFIHHACTVNIQLIERRKVFYQNANKKLQQSKNLSLHEEFQLLNPLDYLRCDIERNSSIQVNYGTFLTQEELDLGCQVSTFSIATGSTTSDLLPYNTYQQWIKGFFLATVTRQIKDRDFLLSVFTLSKLKQIIGIDTAYQLRQYQSFDYLIESQPNSLQTKKFFAHNLELLEKAIINCTPKSSFEEVSLAIGDLSSQETLISSACFSSSNPFKYSVNTLWGAFSNVHFRSRNILDFLCICEDAQLVTDIFLRYKEVCLCFIHEKENKNQALIEFLIYFYLELNVLETGAIANEFRDICCYNINESADFFDYYLTPFFNINDVFAEKNNKFLSIFSVLIYYKNESAIELLKTFMFEKKYDSVAYLNDSFLRTNIIELLQKTSGFQVLKNQKFDIGHYWESVCLEIAKEHLSIDTTCLQQKRSLTNDMIPDIVVGKCTYTESDKIQYAPLIIECKTSTYFADPDILNNPTTEKYINHCDKLQYWILEKAEIRASNYSKVEFLFWEDLLALYPIKEIHKTQINRLLELRKSNITRLRELPYLPPKQLYDLYLLCSNYPSDLTAGLTSKKEKKETMQTDTIRQYSLSGIYIADFPNTSAAAKHCNIKTAAIANAVAGRNNSAAGFLWKRVPLNAKPENITPPNILDTKGKTIYQLDSDGTVINEYANISLASKETHINAKCIRDTIAGRQKTAGGFYWSI